MIKARRREIPCISDLAPMQNGDLKLELPAEAMGSA